MGRRKKTIEGKIYRVTKNDTTVLACGRYETARDYMRELVQVHGGKIKDIKNDSWHGDCIRLNIR